jgi:predicted house-cleaning noncanonical NTP pyrophosphatase (MazG superfamily)
MDEYILKFSPHFDASYRPEHWPEEFFGTKAVGLAKLPADWTPPFFVISTKQDVGQLDPTLLQKAIDRLTAGAVNQLIARSSAPHESLEDRGCYESYGCGTTAAEVIPAVTRVRRHFQNLVQRQRASQDACLAVIVQLYISPIRFGHLSNERRVSRYVTSWHVEYQVTQSESAHVDTFSVKSIASIDPTLECTNVDALNRSLRALAKMFSQNAHRVHFEWVWDGQRLWIVQCDEEHPLRGPSPGSKWRSRGPAQEVIPVQVLTPILEAKGGWPKTQAVRTFHACGLPVAPVFVLENPKILQDLSLGRVDDTLRQDLLSLLHLPILIRTDFSDRLSSAGMLLPRTGAISNADEGTLFLTNTAMQISRQDISPEDYCFTLHQFIGARAGAFSYSKPTVSKVRVDSTWGGPDSLLYYPHDTFEVDARDKKVMSKKVRCKTHYLDMDDRGTWREVQSGVPWDWKPSLTDDELVQIGDSACRVAGHMNKPIEIMYFIGVNDKTGSECCLPWFCTDKVAFGVDHATGVRYAGRRVTVSTVDDVKWIESDLNAQRLKRPLSMRLRPKPELLRSEEFLAEVARVAKNVDIAVELEGSILSHCYYMLRRNGVKVACVDAFEEPTKRKRFGKLVRDRIPLRIEAHGERPRILRVSSDEVLHLLKAKAVEEAIELFWETDNSRIVEELTDLFEVVESIWRVCNKSFDELLAAAEKKRRERGGFEAGVVLLETRSVPLITPELKSVGLFQDTEEDASLTTSEKPLAPSGSQFSKTRRPRADSDGIIISLVPPDPIQPGDAVLAFPDGLHEAKIHYSGCEVRVVIQAPTPLRDQPGQLQLPFPDDS